MNGIKADAEGQEDTDAQKRLLAAAKVLADATAKLVEAAKVRSSFLYSLNTLMFKQETYFVLSYSKYFRGNFYRVL